MSFATALERTEALLPGDKCEFRYPARSEWLPGTVVRNGGAGYWAVDPDEGKRAHGLYIEHVRAPGTDPWGEERAVATAPRRPS